MTTFLTSGRGTAARRYPLHTRVVVPQARGEMTLQIVYRIRITPDQMKSDNDFIESGGYTVQCLDLKGCLSQGETVEACLENIRDAIETWEEAFENPSSREGRGTEESADEERSVDEQAAWDQLQARYFETDESISFEEKARERADAPIAPEPDLSDPEWNRHLCMGPPPMRRAVAQARLPGGPGILYSGGQVALHGHWATHHQRHQTGAWGG